MLRFCSIVIGTLLLFLIASFHQVNASHKQMVLGEATEASELDFPQVSSGPGLITPDSPFYFLDKTYQNFRLMLARPEDKAKLRTKIAGERLAELRLMMAKDNEQGIHTALNELTTELDKAAEGVSLASGQGNDVTDTAVEVNQSIKAQRDALSTLVGQARGKLRLSLQAARASLQESKVRVEDNLPEDLLLSEIEDDLTKEVEEEAIFATDSTRRLERALLRLDELASQAAQQNQERRLNALRRAIEAKDDALLRRRERISVLEERKRERLLEAQQRKEQAVREARLKAEEARHVIEETEKEVDEVEAELEAEFNELERQLPSRAQAGR